MTSVLKPKPPRWSAAIFDMDSKPFETFFSMLKCILYSSTFGTAVLDKNDFGTFQAGGFIIITPRRKEYVKLSPHSRSLKDYMKKCY